MGSLFDRVWVNPEDCLSFVFADHDFDFLAGDFSNGLAQGGCF